MHHMSVLQAASHDDPMPGRSPGTATSGGAQGSLACGYSCSTCAKEILQSLLLLWQRHRKM